MQNFKRKKKLINKSLQLKMISIFTAIGCTCALFQVILVNNGLLNIARSAPSGGDLILQQARGMMLENVAWTLGAMIPLMTCIGIVLTHRVAGPAYRMTEHCKAIAEGQPATPCKIRKHDELHELCDALNAAIERLAPAKRDGEETTEKWNLEDAPTLLSAGSNSTADSIADSSTEAPRDEEEAAA
ncbi:hypothetical protein Poly30_49550 [Planctomycetes bacterium Poly30]|uniref:HAMP domain-containing protein n=1 Tax=Saltatorellus ferox TaxID=2528018 RepID=A0A518EZ91_9BACT|nr:hypothetical protein Poly30_49550 [Planctomycetes bacterium Poly30]